MIGNKAIDENMLQIGGDVDLSAAQTDATLDNIVGKPGPAVQSERGFTSLANRFQDIPGNGWLTFVKAVRGTNRRCEYCQIDLTTKR